jgi:hypothetical protein
MLICSLVYYSTLKKEAKCSFEISVTPDEMRGVLRHKTEPFIATSVRNSDLRKVKYSKPSLIRVKWGERSSGLSDNPE